MKNESRRGVPVSKGGAGRSTVSEKLPLPEDDGAESIVAGKRTPAKSRRPASTQKEKTAFDAFLRNLEREAAAWRAWALIVLALLIAAVGFLLTVGFVTGSMLAGLGGAGSKDSRFLLTYAGLLCAGLAVLCIPAVAVGLYKGRKISALCDGAGLNCSEALDHARSTRNLVLAGLFSLPALIAALKNRSFVNNNLRLLESVERRQYRNAGGKHG